MSKEKEQDWKKLYEEEKVKVEALTKKVEEYKNLYEEEQQFVKKLAKKVKELKKLIPTNNEKKKYATEKENQIAIIQRSIKRARQTSEFVSLVHTFKTSPMAKKLGERNKIIREIVSTEESYCNSLEELIKLYIQPLKRHLMVEKKKKIIDEKDIKIMFNNIDQILSTHKVLLISLQNRLNSFPITNIGDCLYNQVPLFFVYVQYCNKFDEAMDRLRENKKTNPNFDKFCSSSQKKTTGGLDLKSLLIQPVQRLPRYCLLLREIIKNTEETHVDYKNLVKTKNKIEKIVSMINEQKRKHDFEQASKKIDKLLLDEDLKVENREFRLEAYAFVQINDEKPKKAVLFLYKDLIIFAGIVEKSRTFSMNSISFLGKKNSSPLPRMDSGGFSKSKNSFVSVWSGKKDNNRSTYLDDKTGDTLVFRVFHFLKDCTVDITSETEDIELTFTDEKGEEIRYILDIIENPHEHKKQKWSEELTQLVKPTFGEEENAGDFEKIDF
eukprot:gene3802-6963_t